MSTQITETSPKMEPSTDRLLLLIGSGPGIGRSVASRFVQQHFDRVALIARNAEQLEKDREAVLATAAGVNRAVIVQTWQIDIANTERLKEALGEIEQFGRLECVYFNAARVGPSVLFETSVETIEEDFRVREHPTTYVPF
jgi:NAD(P)-dependent dehydrogenase (short-subunit alcohol dehydrogenase family)